MTTDYPKALAAAREKRHALAQTRPRSEAESYALSAFVDSFDDLIAAFDAPAAAVPAQNRDPTRAGLAARLYDSAQLSTLPDWCRGLLREAADNEQELLPLIQRLTTELEAKKDQHPTPPPAGLAVVPEGYAPVPVEPTKAMLEAAASFGGRLGYSAQRREEARVLWADMLAAALAERKGE